DINYHRDHLGIVQNNFPSVIRLGEGDEVLDVPHPLSREGLEAYDYAIVDSLRIRLPDRQVEVYQVRVRPRDDRLPRAIGALYVDRDEGQVVRMAFSFTRAALRDKDLEDVSIVLENALVNGRFWLPRRQEIEIRRTGSWLDYPARGIIRGRWEICCYEVNQGFDIRQFRGPEIVQAPPAEQKRYPWQGRVLDSLPPDVRAATDADVRAVQDEARALVRAEALSRARGLALSARGISDFVRVNRVEGLSLGAGLAHRYAGGISASASGRYGVDDRAGKGELALGWQRASGAGLRLSAFRRYREAGDEAETSGLRNSFAAQEFGSDYTDYYDARGAALAADLGTRLGVRWRVEGGYEWQDALAVHARPAAGRYEGTIPAARLGEARATLSLSRPTALSFFGTELRAAAELRGALYRPRDVNGDFAGPRGEVARAFATASVERPVGVRQRLVLRTTAAGVAGADVPPQELVFLGGPASAPGYDFHSHVGRFGATQRVEWRTPVPFVAVPLGRFGHAPASATLAPFVHAAYVARPVTLDRLGGTGGTSAGAGGWHPSAGVGALFFFDLLRVDLARGLRDGRWSASVDVGRDFWGIL
ncbi:MAG TPA: hypothetical protein VNS52_12075, partial [Gemmatimonadaceae bacterium]|nr:hypothetical protein [Gemmatimonadaceae bacterium]